MFFFVSASIIIWRGFLLLMENMGSDFIAARHLFLGPVPWANFDGIHYLSIAENGYGIFQQSFFPLLPLLLKLFANMSGDNYLVTAFVIVYTSLFLSLILLWKLIKIDFKDRVARWATIFLLAFPTSFFFGSIYTESLFLAFVLGSFYCARKEKWFLASVLGLCASATRLVGIFLLPALLWEWWEQHKFKNTHKKPFWLPLIPTGLIGYMIYLQKTVGDPLAFIHTQPAFGANRTGGEVILLPQVVFRYVKIFATVASSAYDFRIAALEIGSFVFGMTLLFLSWKKIRKSYILFSLLAILGPTLTGTFSSMPRYILVLFPLFIFLGMLTNRFAQYILVVSFLALLGLLTMLFSRGYFVA